MHVGRSYPYLADLWACTSQWWPGFVARKLILSFDNANPFPWADFAGIDWLTEEGIPDATREVVTYKIPLFGAYTVLDAVIATAYPAGKCTTYSIFFNQPAWLAPANALSSAKPDQQFVLFNDTWPTGGAVPPNVVYVPPVLTLRPATWSEV